MFWCFLRFNILITNSPSCKIENFFEFLQLLMKYKQWKLSRLKDQEKIDGNKAGDKPKDFNCLHFIRTCKLFKLFSWLWIFSIITINVIIIFSRCNRYKKSQASSLFNVKVRRCKTFNDWDIESHEKSKNYYDISISWWTIG